jgi:hypothetical protein
MAMNGLAGLAHVLEHGTNEVHIDPALGCGVRGCRLTGCWRLRLRCVRVGLWLGWWRVLGRLD